MSELNPGNHGYYFCYCILLSRIYTGRCSLFYVLQTGWCCGNTRSNLLCQEHRVGCCSFLFLCWRGQIHSYMNANMKTWGLMFWLINECWTEIDLCVLYNYIWGKEFPKNNFAVKTCITTMEICLIWWICFCYQLPGYHILCSWDKIFSMVPPCEYHQYKHLFICFSFIWQWRCSCVSR